MGTKISDFSSATTPLTGAELVPIVQGGSTVKTPVSTFSVAAPVQSVAGRTGAVTLGISDVANLQTSLDGKLSTGGGVISANSSGNALRITQTGTGNALVVEDEANPDATPFVVDASGNVGIGTTSTNNNDKLIIRADQDGSTRNAITNQSSGASAESGIRLSSYGATWDIATGSTAKNSNALTFGVSSSEKVRITSAGDVGIGTSGPTGQLEVYKTNSGAEGGNIVISNPVASGLNSSVALYLVPNNGGGHDLQRAASIKSFQSTVGNFADLRFFTSHTDIPAERLRITSDGNVGIGTSAPATKLDVSGDFQLSGDVRINNAGQYKVVGFYNSGTRKANISYDNTNNWLNVGPESASSQLIFNTSGSEKVRIDSSGNVGIGTSSPAVKLDVAGQLRASSSTLATQLVVSNATGTGQASLQLRREGAATDKKLWEIVQYDESSSGGLAIRAVNDAYTTGDDAISIGRKLTGFGIDSIRFGTNGGERMRIDSSGNVGIGTSAPASKLEINSAGVVQAKIKNTASSADANWSTENTFGNAAFGVNATGAYVYTSAAIPVLFYTGGFEKARIDSSGNLLVGTPTAGTTAAKVLGLGNATAPTTSPAGMGQLYVENGALKYRGSSGTVTTIANA